MFLTLIFFSEIFSQEKGGANPDFNPDSVIVFKSPRPLIQKITETNTLSSGWGGDFLLSDSGFGIGFFFHTFITEELLAYASLYISGARNSDEFEDRDNSGYWTVRNKINRLYKFPLMFGLQQFLFKGSISESLQPYITAGVGPTFILSTPYTYNRIPNGEVMNWFESFNYSEWNTKMGGFVGIGAYFGSLSKSVLGFNIKYYYVPFGDNGLESIIGLPITNFGGIFLSLSIGTSI
jgi:hypothetical protein